MKQSPGESACLVTGVAGFVGSHLAERLLAEGQFVVGVDNFSSGFPQNLENLLRDPGFAFYEDTVTDRGLIARLKALHPGLLYCFHLAAVVSVPFSMENPLVTMEVNHDATALMLEESGRMGFKAFVFAGSAAEYGADERLPLLESYASSRTRHLSPYGESKYLASARVASTPHGIALRCFNIYGPRQHPGSPYSGVISRFVEMALDRQALTVHGDGGQVRDFIYVTDIVEAYLAAAGLSKRWRKPPGGVFNLGTGRGTTVLELAGMINGLTGNTGDLVFGPERPGDIRCSLASTERFRQATGWTPAVDLEEGLRATIEWRRRARKDPLAVSG